MRRLQVVLHVAAAALERDPVIERWRKRIAAAGYLSDRATAQGARPLRQSEYQAHVHTVRLDTESQSSFPGGPLKIRPRQTRITDRARTACSRPADRQIAAAHHAARSLD